MSCNHFTISGGKEQPPHSTFQTSFTTDRATMRGKSEAVVMAPTQFSQSRISGRLSKPGLALGVEQSKKRKCDDEVELPQASEKNKSQIEDVSAGLFHTNKRVRSPGTLFKVVWF